MIIESTFRINFYAKAIIFPHSNKEELGEAPLSSYSAFFTVRGETGDLNFDRIPDLHGTKMQFDAWIFQKWQRKHLVYARDSHSLTLLDKDKIAICSFNPTLPNLATWLFIRVCPQLLIGSEHSVTTVGLSRNEIEYAEAKP